jgi:hypothetical protein
LRLGFLIIVEAFAEATAFRRRHNCSSPLLLVDIAGHRCQGQLSRCLVFRLIIGVAQLFCGFCEAPNWTSNQSEHISCKKSISIENE